MDFHENNDNFKLPRLSKFLVSKSKDIRPDKEIDANDLDFEFLKEILKDDKLQWIFNICQQKYHPVRGKKPVTGQNLEKFLHEGQNALRGLKFKNTEIKEKHKVPQPVLRNFDKILKKQVKDNALKPLPLTQPARHQNVKNVLKRMTDSAGPLASLQKYLGFGQNNTKSQRLRILTRSHSYVRGYCEGYLIAYDHHWNLVLNDVDEYFILRPKIKKILTPTLSNSSACLKLSQASGVKSLAESSILENKFANQHKQTASFSLNCDTHIPNKGIYALSIPPNMTTNQNNLQENSFFNNLGYDPVQNCYHRFRHVPTLFVRGDNVVLICQSPNY